jgi:uncharacterized metal-binding protein YceD (DUF177 family)
MNDLGQFVIPFRGLKPGNHQYHYEIDEPFFDHFEFGEIKKGHVSVRLDVEKEENLLVLHFHFQGNVEVPCDRCAELFSLPISGEDTLIVKPGSGYYEENEEIQVIPESESQLDVSPFIYEYVHLLLPLRRVHPEGENRESKCNPEILKKLNPAERSNNPDPRWEALNKLRDKL